MVLRNPISGVANILLNLEKATKQPKHDLYGVLT
jgi:hypothetical protein